MSVKSTIEWTQSTWNPVTGCTKVSSGCKNCYAERFAERWRGTPGHPYEQGFDLKLWHERLELPLTWKKPQLIFVNSMSDLFHEDVPLEFIKQVFDVMGKANWHIFQVLTKRADRLLELSPHLSWESNIWMGVSVENMSCECRIDYLRKTSARVKFLSLEPLLGPLPNLNLQGINWAIVGGESGPGARPMDPSWVIDIRDQCQKASVPFFFKQWGGVRKHRTGRELEGRTWDEMPSSPRVSPFTELVKV
jgi:protein gp37